VAYLLTNPPPEPIHGLALALRVEALEAVANARGANGNCAAVEADASLQQRSLELDEAESALALRRKQLELEAVVDNDDESEPVKAEALRDLEAIYRFQKSSEARTRDAAQRAADSVGKAIKRFYHHLDAAVDLAGKPHPVLRPFARHLRDFLLVPSGRHGIHGGARLAVGISGGCFTYLPPPRVRWAA